MFYSEDYNGESYTAFHNTDNNTKVLWNNCRLILLDKDGKEVKIEKASM